MASERDEVLLTHAGKIQQIEEIIETADTFSNIHENEAEQLEQLSILRSELNRLREKRDGLKKKLTLNPEKWIAESIVKERKARESDSQEQALDSHKVQKKILEDKRRRRIDDLQVTHRLTGKTVFRTSNGLYGIRFDTYFEDQFCETFYVVLSLDKLDKSKLVVYKHTLPYSVPIKRIETHFLNKNIRLFAQCVHEYVTAHTARRTMLLRIQKQDPSVFNLVASDAADYITFKKHWRGFEFEVRLIYETPRDILPVRCAIFVDENGRKRRIEKAEAFFLQHPLHRALGMAFKERPAQQQQQR